MDWQEKKCTSTIHGTHVMLVKLGVENYQRNVSEAVN